MPFDNNKARRPPQRPGPVPPISPLPVVGMILYVPPPPSRTRCGWLVGEIVISIFASHSKDQAFPDEMPISASTAGRDSESSDSFDQSISEARSHLTLDFHLPTAAPFGIRQSASEVQSWNANPPGEGAP